MVEDIVGVVHRRLRCAMWKGGDEVVRVVCGSMGDDGVMVAVKGERVRDWQYDG